MIDKLIGALSHVLPGVDLSQVTEDTRLEKDLGLDSLAFMMLAFEIEDAFGFRFEELVKFETVGDVCRYVEAHC